MSILLVVVEMAELVVKIPEELKKENRRDARGGLVRVCAKSY